MAEVTSKEMPRKQKERPLKKIQKAIQDSRSIRKKKIKMLNQVNQGKFCKVFFVLLMLLLVLPLSTSWWNSSWEYRKGFNISERSGVSLSNYQVEITVDTKKLIAEERMQNDCSDIRWTNDRNDKLDYWISSGCNTTETQIYVELSSLSASSAKKIYMYYGNDSVSSSGDPEETMYIYDLNGKGFDGSLYGSANYHSSSEFIELTDTTDNQQGSIRYSQGTPSPGFYAEWEWYTGDGTDADSNNLVAWNNGNRFEHEDPNGNGVHYFLNDHDDCNGVTWNNECGDIESWSENPAKSSWQQAEAYGVRDENTLRYYFNTMGNTVEGNWTNSNFPPGDQFGWSGRTGGLNNHHWVRKIMVRKYTDPEPKVETLDDETFTLCDFRGPLNQCVLNSSRDLSNQNYTVEAVLDIRSEASLEALSGQGLIEVSNNTIFSGLWTGNFEVRAEKITIKEGARFRPGNERIILGKVN